MDTSDSQATDLPNGSAAAGADTSTAASSPESGAAPAAEAAGKEASQPTLFEHVTKALETSAAEAAAPKGEAAKDGEPAKDGKPAVDAKDKPAGEAGKEAPADGKGKKKGEGTPAPERVRELLAERKVIEPKAQQWDGLQTWVHQNGLTPEDVNFGLGLMAQVRADPFKAWEQLQPLIAHLQGVVGEVLPDDLKKRVEGGTLNEDDARSIAAGRSKVKVFEQREQRRTESDQAADERRRVGEFATACGRAVQVWETEFKETDPDYARKKDMVQSEIYALWAREGQPETPAKAVDQAKRARATVEDRLKGIMPSKPHVDPARGGESARTRAVPRTALEAAEMALAGP